MEPFTLEWYMELLEICFAKSGYMWRNGRIERGKHYDKLIMNLRKRIIDKYGE